MGEVNQSGRVISQQRNREYHYIHQGLTFFKVFTQDYLSATPIEAIRSGETVRPGRSRSWGIYLQNQNQLPVKDERLPGFERGIIFEV